MAQKIEDKNQQSRRKRRNYSELKSALGPDRSRADKAVIFITNILGSIGFLSVFIFGIIIYALWNLGLLAGLKTFDDYPFDALDTILSVFAVTLSISVLISQNRQRRLEKVREQIEFEVNVRAETEITKMLGMLYEIQQKLGIDKPDEELDEMKEALDLNKLHEKVGKNMDDI